MNLFTLFVRTRRAAQKIACNKRRTRLVAEILEDRSTPSVVGFRSIDGSGNNAANPTWGSAGVDFLRVAPAAYGDGVSTPAGADRPSARDVSNTVADQGSQDVLSSRGLSAMIYAWGQFLDHDLDLTAGGTQSFNVAVPKGDPYFDPNGTGTQVIYLNRSAVDPSTGTTTPGQQINTITAWIDGSQIYGSDAVTASKLRTHSGGRLKTGPGDTLPLNNAANFPDGVLDMANDAHVVSDDQLYAAGDRRANENIELLSLHTTFLREHNRLADLLAKSNPSWSDEQIYQQARAMVIAEEQAITYNEWIPAVLGVGALKPYQGYNPNVNPGISNEFATAAFRLGHSMLGDDVQFLDASGNAVAPSQSLSNVFFNPTQLQQNGVESILKYLSSDVSQEVDTQVVNSVRNFLFGPPGAGGFDLASLNIQRGRDHGLADYNSMRAAYGLPKVHDFSDITANKDLQAKLRSLYGTVENIDAWVGMLAEDHVPGTSVGPLVRQVLIDQFTRLRDGDRFWYQNEFSGAQLRDLQNLSLSDVISRNTNLTNIQHDPFFFKAGIDGVAYIDVNSNGHRDPGELGLAGRTIELVDGSGNIVLSTTTDAAGRYHFDTMGGLSLGSYIVEEIKPDGGVVKSSTVSLTRGDIFLHGVDLGEPGKIPPVSPPPIAPPPGPPKPAGNHQAPPPPQSPPPKQPANAMQAPPKKQSATPQMPTNVSFGIQTSGNPMVNFNPGAKGRHGAV